MKYLGLLITILLLFGCSTAQLVDTWKNPETTIFESSKVLIVGMTPNMDARSQFEKQLKAEYQARGIQAFMSIDIFEPDFTLDKKSEEEINRVINILIANDFDAILVTKIAGVEDKLNFLKTYSNIENTRKRFRDDYYMNQEIYFNQDYYEKYKIYHAETSLYCLCPAKERELIWKGYIDITDPRSINKTIKDYTNLLMDVLEEQQLISPKSNLK